MAALVRQDAVLKAVFPDAGAELGADATEIARLYRDLDRVKEQDNPRTARLLVCGRRKMAQKLMEEAGEIALEAVRHRSRAVVRESADLIYHLVVLWRECGIAPDEVWREMSRRADKLGITEFIGISLALGYLGLSKPLGVTIAAALIMVAACTGNFRRFERFSLFLVVGSLLLIPVFLMVHPPLGQMAGDFLMPRLPQGGASREIMLLIIAIVGPTVAPWQLFFQQSYVIDQHITPRFIQYERADLWIGIVLVTIGAVALVAIGAAVFAARPEFGQFSDAGAVASGLEKYVGPVPAMLFALALLDACIIGAAAVSLSTAYAIGDVLDLRHSLHRKPTEAKTFHGVYCGLIALTAALVLTLGTPLGLLTNAVQTLAGVLLPSATVFLLLLCNDKAVLGPWVNNRWLNLFTGAVIALLVLLSMILTASVLYPEISGKMIIEILVAGGVATVATFVAVSGFRRRSRAVNAPDDRLLLRDSWRMPPLDTLPPRRLTLLDRTWLSVLRAYLLLAAGLVLVRIVTLATAGL